MYISYTCNLKLQHLQLRTIFRYQNDWIFIDKPYLAVKSKPFYISPLVEGLNKTELKIGANNRAFTETFYYTAYM